MRKLTPRQSNQSKRAEIVSHYYQWQILKPRYWERILGASLPTQIKACFNAMETSQFNMFVQKVKDYAISWESYACCVFGFSGSTVSQLSEA
jgi:hypothetical protein